MSAEVPPPTDKELARLHRIGPRTSRSSSKVRTPSTVRLPAPPSKARLTKIGLSSVTVPLQLVRLPDPNCLALMSPSLSAPFVKNLLPSQTANRLGVISPISNPPLGRFRIPLTKSKVAEPGTSCSK